MNVRSFLTSVERIVVKVGTSTITHETGKLNLTQLEHIVRDLASLCNDGKEIILVTSGAVGAGFGKLNRPRPMTIPEKQAMAAVGQGALMHVYEKLFAEYGITVGQVLLTKSDITDPHRRQNSRNTLLKLLLWQVVPIINENDTVATDEIKFGDNDTLAAYVASLVDAELLVILSDIDGFYTSDPKRDPDARLVPLVDDITWEMKHQAEGAGSINGIGGMITKLLTAEVTMNDKIPMVIANGFENGIVRQVVSGEQVGTLFTSPSIGGK